MSIFAIDPGCEESGYAWLASGVIATSGVLPNTEVLSLLKSWPREMSGISLAIEMVASYGMAVGREVFETVRWIGRFQQAWSDPESVILVYRKDVKLNLCQSLRAKDTNIRQALIDRIGPQGTKKEPGPTYGVKSHAWAALAVAVTAVDQELKQREAA